MEGGPAKKLAARLQELEEKVPGQLHAWLLDKKTKESMWALARDVTTELKGLCRDFAHTLDEDQRKKKRTIDPDLAALLPAVRTVCWGLLALSPLSGKLLGYLDSMVYYPLQDLASLGHLKQARDLHTRISSMSWFSRTPKDRRADRLVELALVDKELPFSSLVEACAFYVLPRVISVEQVQGFHPRHLRLFGEKMDRLPWSSHHLVALRRACLRFGPYAFMGRTLGVLVEYALIGLAWSPEPHATSTLDDDDDDDDDDWRQECIDLLDVHLGFDDEARKSVIDSLPAGKLKTELQAQESQTFDLSGLLDKLGPDAQKQFEEFDQLMKSCPQV